jgi:hypothetical protein
MAEIEANIPTPIPSPLDEEALRKLKCDDEFSRFDKERDTLTKAELENEKGYDTLLVTLSTLAIGSSFTILKDILRTTGASALIILSWSAFGLCLFIALADKLLSYWTHKKWREVLDAEFKTWREGAWERAQAKYPGIKFVRALPHLKWVAFVALLFGVIFLMAFVFVGTGAPPAEEKTPAPPVTVNVYNGASPTTVPIIKQVPP